MPQLDVYVNPDEDSRSEVPFLLDIQHDMHCQLRTRLVVPLVRSEIQKIGIHALCPVFSINGENVFASIPEMAALPARELNEKVISLTKKRDEIFGAIDLLLHGF